MIEYKVLRDFTSIGRFKGLEVILKKDSIIKCCNIIGAAETLKSIPTEVIKKFNVGTFRGLSNLKNNTVYLYLKSDGENIIVAFNSYSGTLNLNTDVELVKGKEIINELNNIIAVENDKLTHRETYSTYN